MNDINVPPVDKLSYSPVDGNSAQEENKVFDKFEDLKRQGEHEREEGTRNVATNCIKTLIILVAVIIGATIIITAWHYLAPANLCWLPDSQVAQLTTFLFSSAIAGIISPYFQRRE